MVSGRPGPADTNFSGGRGKLIEIQSADGGSAQQHPSTSFRDAPRDRGFGHRGGGESSSGAGSSAGSSVGSSAGISSSGAGSGGMTADKEEDDEEEGDGEPSQRPSQNTSSQRSRASAKSSSGVGKPNLSAREANALLSILRSQDLLKQGWNVPIH